MLSEQQTNLLAWLRGRGATGAILGSHDHKPAARLLALGLIVRIEGRRYRAA